VGGRERAENAAERGRNVSTTGGRQVCWVWRGNPPNRVSPSKYQLGYIYIYIYLGVLCVHIAGYICVNIEVGYVRRLQLNRWTADDDEKYEATSESHRITYMHQYSGNSGMFFSFIFFSFPYFAQIYTLFFCVDFFFLASDRCLIYVFRFFCGTKYRCM